MITIATPRLFQILLFLALCITLAVATSKSDLTSATGINDKVAHILTFLLLGLLVRPAFPLAASRLQPYLWLLTYGLGIEVIQYFIPTRSFSLLDLTADAAGLLLSVALALTIRQATRAY